MSTNQETLKSTLFKFLRTNGYQPTMLDSSGKEMGITDEADVFQFSFVKDGRDYGTVTIGVDGSGIVTVYYGEGVAKSPTAKSEDGSMSWHQLEVALRKVTFGLGVRRFQLKDESDLRYDMAKRQHTKQLEEAYIPVNKNTTLNDSVPTVKLRIQHTRNLGEGEQRFRNIARIYVENTNGERFLLTTKKPGLARVYARHIAEGGEYKDSRWAHLDSLVEEYNKMAGFVRATKNNNFNESTQQLVAEGVNHYISLRETLQKLTGKKGYTSYFESWAPTLSEDTENVVDLAEKFKSNTLDPRIECVMPILARLTKQINEDPMKEIKELEEWALSIQEADGQKDGDYLGATEKANNISTVVGQKEKQHPFKGKLVGASESAESDEEALEETVEESEVSEGQEDLDAIRRIIKK